MRDFDLHLVLVIFNKQTLGGDFELIQWMIKFWKLTFSSLLKVNSCKYCTYCTFVNIWLILFSVVLFAFVLVKTRKNYNIGKLSVSQAHNLITENSQAVKKMSSLQIWKICIRNWNCCKENKNTRQRLRLCFIYFIIILRFCWNW